jgi:hypothetical protein
MFTKRVNTFVEKLRRCEKCIADWRESYRLWNGASFIVCGGLVHAGENQSMPVAKHSRTHTHRNFDDYTLLALPWAPKPADPTWLRLGFVQQLATFPQA